MSYFLVIPSHLLEVEELNLLDCFLIASLLQLSNKYGYCYASNNYLAKQLKSCITTVKKELSKLKDLGYITTTIIYKPNSKEVQERQIKLLTKSIDFIYSNGLYDPSKVSEREYNRSEEAFQKYTNNFSMNEPVKNYK